MEYEGLLCFECGRVGHIGEACLSKKPPAGADAGGSGGQEANIRGDRFSSEDRAFGPWMIVTKTNRRGTRTGKQGIENSGAVASGSGSRFDALASELAQDERAQPAGASLHATLGQVRDKNNRQAHVTKDKSVTPVPHALGKGKEFAGTQLGVSRGGKVRAEPSISKPYMAGNHKDISNMEMEVSTVSAPVNSLGTLQTFNISVQAPKGRLVNTLYSVNYKGSLLGSSDSSHSPLPSENLNTPSPVTSTIPPNQIDHGGFVSNSRRDPGPSPHFGTESTPPVECSIHPCYRGDLPTGANSGGSENQHCEVLGGDSGNVGGPTYLRDRDNARSVGEDDRLDDESRMSE